MAKTTAAVDPAPVDPVAEAPAATGILRPDSWFAPDPFSATLAASPNWPVVPPLEPAAAVDLATAPKMIATPTQQG